MTKYKVIEEIYNENNEMILKDERIVEDIEEAISIYEACKTKAKMSNETKVISSYIITENWNMLMESDTINPTRIIKIN